MGQLMRNQLPILCDFVDELNMHVPLIYLFVFSLIQQFTVDCVASINPPFWFTIYVL